MSTRRSTTDLAHRLAQAKNGGSGSKLIGVSEPDLRPVEIGFSPAHQCLRCRPFSEPSHRDHWDSALADLAP